MKAKVNKGLLQKDWFPCNFEEVADEVDKEDEVVSGDYRESAQLYKKYGCPYLCAAGIEDGIRTMSPLMLKVATAADFMQCDITYDECTESLTSSMQLSITMVIGRIRVNKQDSCAYALAFKKLLSRCQADNPEYVLGKSIVGLVVDWSDAQIKRTPGGSWEDNSRAIASWL